MFRPATKLCALIEPKACGFQCASTVMLNSVGESEGTETVSLFLLLVQRCKYRVSLFLLLVQSEYLCFFC